MRVKIDGTKLVKTLNNILEYSDSFYRTAKLNELKISKSLAEMSVDSFYDYLDGLARSHPGMLHHVYEWGQTGNPYQRLFELSIKLRGKTAEVGADFLYSDSISNNGTTSFYNKAEVMEEGIPVIINQIDAKALFFEIDGEDFFRLGPIYIANPGGEATRGSFKKAFKEFYGVYFEEVYLESIQFYQKLRNPKQYSRNIKNASKSNNAASAGKSAALSWIKDLTGDSV
jgi:hypothetical protein